MNIIHILYSHYHPKIIRNILQNKQKASVSVFMRLHRYNINRPRSRHGHKSSKNKNCLVMMMVIQARGEEFFRAREVSAN